MYLFIDCCRCGWLSNDMSQHRGNCLFGMCFIITVVLMKMAFQEHFYSESIQPLYLSKQGHMLLDEPAGYNMSMSMHTVICLLYFNYVQYKSRFNKNVSALFLSLSCHSIKFICVTLSRIPLLLQVKKITEVVLFYFLSVLLIMYYHTLIQ